MTTMINQPQTIIHVKKGHKVPKELLETALRKCPTASGCAVRDEQEAGTTIQSDQFNGQAAIDDMMTLDTDSEDSEIVYFLANLPGAHAAEDIQPFVLTVRSSEEDEGTDILAFFLEGDFPKYSDAKSGHTDEYNFAQEIIIPTLQEMYLAADQDIGKFTASLHKPLFEKNLMAHVGHRAAFVFLPLNGDVVKFGNNDLGMGFDWGSCSQHLDFSKVPITQKVTEAAKKFNMFGKKSADKTYDHNTHQEKPTDKVVDKVATDTVMGKTLVKPPAGLEKSARNRWLRIFNKGQLPDKHDHGDFKGIWVSADQLPYAQRTNIKTVADVDSLGNEMRTGKKVETPKDMKEDKPHSKSVSDYLPILSDQEMIDLTGTLAKFIDRSKVPTALEIQKMESPWPVFSEKAGIPFTDTFRWRLGEEISQLSRKALENLYLETRRELIKKWDPATMVKKEDEKPVILGPDGKPATTTASTKRAQLFGIKKSA